MYLLQPLSVQNIPTLRSPQSGLARPFEPASWFDKRSGNIVECRGLHR